MKSRLLILLACALASQAAVRAQDKPKTPTPSAPKVLVFPPGTKQPQAMAEASEKPLTPAISAPDGVAQIVAIFFGSLERNDVDQAWNILMKGSTAFTTEELKQMKVTTEEAIKVLGRINGFDLVESKFIGNRLVRVTYLSLGEFRPLHWRFYFYKPSKPEDTWILIDVRVDGNIPVMFDEPRDPRNPKSEAH
jgi:hypothetical protein